MGGGAGGGGNGGRKSGGGGAEVTTSGGVTASDAGNGQVKIEIGQGMSHSTAGLMGTGVVSGSKNWWIRDSNGNFAEIGKHPGDKALSITTRMDPGKYSIGTGPQRGGFRGTITVGAPGSKKAAPAAPKFKAAPSGSRPGSISEIGGKRYKVAWRADGNHVLEPI
jgi:hypothetical protein